MEHRGERPAAADEALGGRGGLGEGPLVGIATSWAGVGGASGGGWRCEGGAGEGDRAVACEDPPRSWYVCCGWRRGGGERGGDYNVHVCVYIYKHKSLYKTHATEVKT